MPLGGTPKVSPAGALGPQLGWLCASETVEALKSTPKAKSKDLNVMVQSPHFLTRNLPSSFWFRHNLVLRYEKPIAIYEHVPAPINGTPKDIDPASELREDEKIVTLEIAVVPMALGLPLFALVFSFANAVLLAYRIRIENQALGWAARLLCTQ